MCRQLIIKHTKPGKAFKMVKKSLLKWGPSQRDGTGIGWLNTRGCCYLKSNAQASLFFKKWMKKGKRNNTILGHVRTAVSGGMTSNDAHPYIDETFEILLTHNGWLYGYEPLRKELQDMGHTFDTDVDSETLLHAVEEWGVGGCVDKLIEHEVWGNVNFIVLRKDGTIEAYSDDDLYYVKCKHFFIISSEKLTDFAPAKKWKLLDSGTYIKYDKGGIVTKEIETIDAIKSYPILTNSRLGYDCTTSASSYDSWIKKSRQDDSYNVGDRVRISNLVEDIAANTIGTIGSKDIYYSKVYSRMVTQYKVAYVECTYHKDGTVDNKDAFRWLFPDEFLPYEKEIIHTKNINTVKNLYGIAFTTFEGCEGTFGESKPRVGDTTIKCYMDFPISGRPDEYVDLDDVEYIQINFKEYLVTHETTPNVLDMDTELYVYRHEIGELLTSDTWFHFGIADDMGKTLMDSGCIIEVVKTQGDMLTDKNGFNWHKNDFELLE